MNGSFITFYSILTSFHLEYINLIVTIVRDRLGQFYRTKSLSQGWLPELVKSFQLVISFQSAGQHHSNAMKHRSIGCPKLGWLHGCRMLTLRHNYGPQSDLKGAMTTIETFGAMSTHVGDQGGIRWARCWSSTIKCVQTLFMAMGANACLVTY